MVSERDLLTACWREHRALIACCAQQARNDVQQQEELAHHSIVLAVLRDALQSQYHRIFHAAAGGCHD